MIRAKRWGDYCASIFADTDEERAYLADVVASINNQESSGCTREFLTTIDKANSIESNWIANAKKEKM